MFAPGVQLTHRRDLRRVQLARTSSHRSTRDPPPGHSKLPRHHVENFGIGQNTGETLPKFRQKSKGNLKRI
ncbi:N-terminal nucleophile aminohydrolases superfamily protein [Prunus dulcis]|uniref:N-terminal nucleophile aminohydrolases superfamily protein n=1 Tax=Prunus dulcis TaxID=3755 RepID=A0A4Y1RML9_PRUDU|nr:N-terminal nucleophile aminohydrolases superfamily protein [Prunus dulcis]